MVFARGSGPSRRGNAWTLGFVSMLVGNGYGVLLPDKRGSGESEGDWRWDFFRARSHVAGSSGVLAPIYSHAGTKRRG